MDPTRLSSTRLLSIRLSSSSVRLPAGLRVAALLAAALVLAGCATRPVAEPKPLPAIPAGFRGVEGPWIETLPVSAAAAPQDGRWWRVFGDPALDRLVERAEIGNDDLEIARARLVEARAALRDAEAARRPQAEVGAGLGRQTVEPGLGAPGQAVTIGQIGARASWEPDLFGRGATARDAAGLDLAADEARLAGAVLLVQSEVVRLYFQVRAIDSERALVRASVAAWQDTLALTERRQRAGDVADLDLARIRSEVESTTSEQHALDRRRSALVNAIALLLGAVPGGFALDAADWPERPPVVPAGVPGMVLTRRPDVAAAQRAMQAARLRVGVAEKAWFPDVALTANAGLASTDLGELFRWSARAWGIGALLALPIFDGGRRDAALQAASGRWDAAAARYRQQVLGAFRDVEDALAALTLLGRESEARERVVAASAEASRLSETRYRNGYVSQLELLDARRSELGNRRQALAVRAARFESTIALVRALGGGWGTGDARAAVDGGPPPPTSAQS